MLSFSESSPMLLNVSDNANPAPMSLSSSSAPVNMGNNMMMSGVLLGSGGVVVNHAPTNFMGLDTNIKKNILINKHNFINNDIDNQSNNQNGSLGCPTTATEMNFSTLNNNMLHSSQNINNNNINMNPSDQLSKFLQLDGATDDMNLDESFSKTNNFNNNNNNNGNNIISSSNRVSVKNEKSDHYSATPSSLKNVQKVVLNQELLSSYGLTIPGSNNNNNNATNNSNSFQPVSNQQSFMILNSNNMQDLEKTKFSIQHQQNQQQHVQILVGNNGVGEVQQLNFNQMQTIGYFYIF